MKKAFAFEIKEGENLTDHWLTPRFLIESAGPFDLDPCAYRAQPWRTATLQYALPEQDGLILPWNGSVFCNPPYGPETRKWTWRLALHNDGLLLIFARTETTAFRAIWKHAAGILFFYRRLRFHRPDGSLVGGGGAPSVLAAFGGPNVARLERVKKNFADGALVTAWQR